MIVIGLNVGLFHDATACAIVDGELVYATEEERYTRYKHAVNQPPFNSLVNTFRFLKGMGLHPGDVDAFATNFNLRLYWGWLGERLHYVWQFIRLNDLYVKYGLMPSYVEFGMGLLRGDYPLLIRKLIRAAARTVDDDLDYKDIRLVPVRHHLAHAASAYYFSGSAVHPPLCWMGEASARAPPSGGSGTGNLRRSRVSVSMMARLANSGSASQSA